MLDRPHELAERFAAAGACLFRHLLPAEALAPLRSAMLVLLAEAGIVSPSKAGEPTPAAATSRPEPAPLSARPPAADPRLLVAQPASSDAAPLSASQTREVDPLLYRALFALSPLHELLHHPRLVGVARALLPGEDLFVHPRPAVRVVPPAGASGAAVPTPPHQDHLGMQGSENALVAWLPLVDCPLELGPIAVAEGSQLLGRRPYRPLPRARVLPCDAGDLDSAWRSSGLEAGDVVVFHALSVHRALSNRTGCVRLSVDLRCQPAAEPVCELTVRDDPAQPWDEVYAGLPAGSPATAWRAMPLRIVPFDSSVLASEQRSGDEFDRRCGDVTG